MITEDRSETLSSDFEATFYFPVGSPISIPLSGESIEEASQDAAKMAKGSEFVFFIFEDRREFVDLKKAVRFTVARKPAKTPRQPLRPEVTHSIDGQRGTLHLYGAPGLSPSER